MYHILIDINMGCIETRLILLCGCTVNLININMGCIETFVPKLRKIIECDKH